MMRSILLSVLLLLVMIASVRAYQTPSQHGCDAEHLPGIASTTTSLDYTAACATYSTCLGEGVASELCQMRVVLMLESGCTDRLCEIRARLYAATITIYQYPQTELST
ncbi:MAG: hypothetical protein H7X77_10540 [Anaerolineae bacterium]|nr:hypothetical protein [Anaerolineae bacterium]